MWQALLRRRISLAIAAVVVGGGVAVVAGIGLADARRGRGQPDAPRATQRPAIEANLLHGFDPMHKRLENGHYVVDLPGARKAVLSLDPGLQSFMETLFTHYQVPFGALVALDPHTGRVLAFVGHSSANPSAADSIVLDASPPAASVFKIITGAALLEAGGVTPESRACYHGGFSGLGEGDITDDPARDRTCATLADAMGGSINAVFAKLSLAHLRPEVLDRYAASFAFGQTLPFDVPTHAGTREVPTDRLEFARASAGFWHNHMSPFQAALIAATVAADGQMPRAGMIDRVVDDHGAVLAAFEPGVFRSVIGASTARALNHMMRRTVTDGTAHHTFYDGGGVPFIPGVLIAGKTGTLNGANPYRGYTWWVGFAPADRPTIALAALVVNTPIWQIKASFAAREALRYYLVEAHHGPGAPAPVHAADDHAATGEPAAAVNAPSDPDSD